MAFNLRSVDLNLLPVFEAVYEERSLSRAAQRLALTQPAVSHALGRLRHTFRDPLFTRQARGVAPTNAADALYERLAGAMASVREAVSESRAFDPGTSTRGFAVAITHPLGPIIALAVLGRLASTAPSVTVRFSTRSRPIDLDRQLRDGRLDAVVDWIAPADRHLQSVVAFEDRLVIMGRTGHPLAGRRLSRAALGRAAFVALRPRSDGAALQDHALRAWRPLAMNVVLEVSELLEVLLVCARSDLLCLMPASLATVARRNFGVVALPLTFSTPGIPVRMFWHARHRGDAAHAFLRDQLLAASLETVAS